MKSNFQTFTHPMRWRLLKRRLQPYPKQYAYRKWPTMQRENTLNGRLIWFVIVMLTALALSGCQTQQIKPCVQPTIPTAPVSQKPTPSPSYSESARLNMLMWRDMLTNGHLK